MGGFLGAAVGLGPDAAARPSLRPRLGAVSFLHRFGSALNHHVHLHACVTDGLFTQCAEGQATEFLPARTVTPADRQAAAKKNRVVRVVDQKTIVVPLYADTLADPDKLLASLRSLLDMGRSDAGRRESLRVSGP